MLPPGTAPIKQEFLLSTQSVSTPVADDDAAEGTTRRPDARDGQAGSLGPQRSKKQPKDRGSNKGRRFGKVKDDHDLCWKVANGSMCEFGADKCRFSHDVAAYLAAKPADVHMPAPSQFSESAPFVPDMDTLRTPHPLYPTLDTTTTCPVFAETGECRYGFKCRFLGGHVAVNTDTDPQAPALTLVGDDDQKARAALTANEINFVSAEVQRQLRSRKYPTPISDAYIAQISPPPAKSVVEGSQVIFSEPEQQLEDEDVPMAPPVAPTPVASDIKGVDAEAQEDTPDVPLRMAEKKRLHWRGKTYLAPLTTVGNLPFRRLCVDYGADITCGEMGLATSFLSGSKEEWSLVRRHPSEKIFGAQIAGNKPHNLVPTAEVIRNELGSSGVDFVDLNCGCPIDLVFKQGSGSALLDSTGKLGKILIGMNKALDDIPLTVKLRTGVKDGKNTAHKLMPRLATEFGASCITLHGRTRQQRYTRLADWNYISECVKAVREAEESAGLEPVPIFGGGDVFSYASYKESLDVSGVDGIMVGRGALIKPWIFTELQEGREWDISARERLEGIEKYARYGLNHFGSDTTGVNATRRYLCEALSFQYRYIPIGLLEVLPGRINHRAPAFKGRNELETLLSSQQSSDWVKISEMFLGPAPEGWVFTPKHKSNSYGEEAQG